MGKLKKIGKWTGIILSGLILLLLIIYVYVYFSTENRINTTFAQDIPAITIPADSFSIAHGEHLYHIRGCVDCHGTDLAGKIYKNDPLLVELTIPNLTKGTGGLPDDFDVKDWVRVLRYGLDKNGKSLWIMPSHESAQLSKSDLADLIAFCSSRPAVNTNNPQLHKLGPIGRIVLALDQAVLLPAERIDHSPTLIDKHISEISASYGKYLTVACQGCHRPNLEGGGPLAPGYPDVPNITSAGEPGNWTEESFIKTLRSGQTPEGKKLRNEYMPWLGMKHFTEDELKAIFLYLKSLPQKEK